MNFGPAQKIVYTNCVNLYHYPNVYAFVLMQCDTMQIYLTNHYMKHNFKGKADIVLFPYLIYDPILPLISLGYLMQHHHTHS